MLRSKRKSLRLTQEKASKLLGISESFLSLIENKHYTNLNLSLMTRICEFYHFDIDKFIKWLKS